MRHHGSILETCYKFLGGQRKERERKRRGIGEEGGLPSPSLRKRAKFPTRCKTKFTKFAQRLVLRLSPCTSSSRKGGMGGALSSQVSWGRVHNEKRVSPKWLAAAIGVKGIGLQKRM